MKQKYKELDCDCAYNIGIKEEVIMAIFVLGIFLFVGIKYFGWF